MPALQKFDFTSSQYERPNLNWICGRSLDGQACSAGPDPRGRCRRGAECRPRRDGDRWVCTRFGAASGPCEEGPMSDGACAHPIPPCVPVRSPRAKRGLAVRWALVVAIGFLAVLLGSSGRTWLMPGPLTSAHISLGECQSCHATVAEGAFAWIRSAFMPAAPEKDSAKCIGCHVAGEHPLRAHGMPAEALAASTKRIAARLPDGLAPRSASLGAMLFPAARGADRTWPCATCHVEHRGERAVLTTVPESTCRTCHVAQFGAFSSGHPEFERYPFERRTRIVFDHVSHFSRHFADADKKGAATKVPAACVDCHLLGPNGRLMASRSFETSCAGCHIDQIRGFERAVGPRGVAFLVIPGLDIETLRARKIGIGAWPPLAESKLTPIMKLLLAADPEVKAALEATASLDLLDLRQASRVQLAAVERLAWAVKGLLQELAEGGGEKLRQRLAAATGGRPDDALLARLIASIPRDVLAGARRDWLPDLSRDIADRNAGKTVPIPARRGAAATPAPASPAAGAAKDTGDILAAPKDTGDILAGGEDKGDILTGAETPAAPTAPAPAPPPKAAGVDAEAFARLGGWYRQDFSVLFHPTGHADPFLKAWLDYSAATFGTAGQPAGEAVFRQLAAKDAQGQCVKCHSVEQAADNRLSVMWQPKMAAGASGGYTHFTHQPHIRVALEGGCLTCHQLDREAKYQASFETTDPHRPAPNFKPISQKVCADCHTRAAAGESCVQCHRYHATPITTPAMRTKVSEAISGAPHAAK